MLLSTYRRWVVLLAAVLLLAGCGFDETPVPPPTRAPTRTPTIAPTRTLTPTRAPTITLTPYPLSYATVGETIEAGRVSLTVNRVISPTVDARTAPAAGNKYVVVDLTLQNTGGTSVPITVSRDMVLKDSTDQIYRLSTRATNAANGVAPDMTLAPGERIVAQVGYELPAAAAGLVFTFTAERFDAGKMFVTLPDAAE